MPGCLNASLIFHVAAQRPVPGTPRECDNFPRIRSVRNHDELTAIPKRASDAILTGQRDLPISGAEVVRYAFGTYLRQLWASLKPSTSRAFRFDIGASNSSISRVIFTLGHARARNSRVGVLSVMVSLTALK